MPSNRELIAEAKTLGEELGVEVDTARKNNRELTELVEDLRARRGGVSGDQPAPSDASKGDGEPPSEPVPPAGQEALPGLTAAAPSPEVTPPAPVSPAPPPPAPTAPAATPAPRVSAATPAARPSSGPSMPARSGEAASGTRPLRYLVAPGKALTSPRGVLGPGAEIRPTDVADGVAQLERLMAAGFVVVE